MLTPKLVLLFVAYYVQSASKWYSKFVIHSYARTILASIDLIIHFVRNYNDEKEKISVGKWLKKIDQNSLDGSAPARLDI